MFKVGDKVFYPNHGAGVIKGIEEKEVLGQVRQYYLIYIPNINMKIMVPKDNAEKIGLRHVCDRNTLKAVINKLHQEKDAIDLPWKDRFKINNEKIKTGQLYETASAYKDLLERSKEKSLNTSEKQLFHKAHKYLISEICMVEGISEDEAEKLLA